MPSLTSKLLNADTCRLLPYKMSIWQQSNRNRLKIVSVKWIYRRCPIVMMKHKFVLLIVLLNKSDGGAYMLVHITRVILVVSSRIDQAVGGWALDLPRHTPHATTHTAYLHTGRAHCERAHTPCAARPLRLRCGGCLRVWL